MPKFFHVDLPEAFTIELLKCKTDAEVTAVGVEWCIAQSKELMEKGFPVFIILPWVNQPPLKKL